MKIQDRTQTAPQIARPATHGHPTVATFLGVGAILFVLTGIEFGIVYLKGMQTIVIAGLFALSIVKFYLVARYFMHLKFESKLLNWVFLVGLVLAGLIAIAQKIVNAV